MQKIGKFDVKEKCKAFTVNRNLIFIDSVQFMNSSLECVG